MPTRHAKMFTQIVICKRELNLKETKYQKNEEETGATTVQTALGQISRALLYPLIMFDFFYLYFSFYFYNVLSIRVLYSLLTNLFVWFVCFFFG